MLSHVPLAEQTPAPFTPLDHEPKPLNGTAPNQKVHNGLRAQYSPERINEIIHQASAAWHYRNPHTKNNPELYELFENELIDEALQTLGYSKWAIGRPKLGDGNSPDRALNGFRPNGQLGGSTGLNERPLSGVAPKGETQPSVTKLFRAHIPEPGALRKAYSEWANSIEYRNLLVVGDQSSGKTTLVERLAEDLSEWYKPFQVSAYQQTGGLDRLLVYGSRSLSKAWFLAGEDLTLAKIPRPHTSAFFQVRQLIHAQTGLREGLAVTVFNSHTFFGIDKNLRITFAMLLPKTIPTNPYDRALLKKYFDADLLKRFEREAKDDDVLVWDKYHQSGVWAKVWLPTKNLLKQVLPAPKARLSLLSSGLIVATIVFVLVMLASMLPRLLQVRGS